MKSDLVYIFDFIIKQWSFTPESFKDVIINAALAKFVLSAIWWAVRFLAGKFPASQVVSVFSALLNTKPAKFIVVMLDVTLIDVFLFFAAVALLDLNKQFSYFSLWSATLFSFLFVYMLMITHADVKRYCLVCGTGHQGLRTTRRWRRRGEDLLRRRSGARRAPRARGQGP